MMIHLVVFIGSISVPSCFVILFYFVFETLNVERRTLRVANAKSSTALNTVIIDDAAHLKCHCRGANVNFHSSCTDIGQFLFCILTYLLFSYLGHFFFFGVVGRHIRHIARRQLLCR